ncbi:MAG: efflux RND transporter periplasmic adaptor subunit [Isosphaeraceae bacterium]
MLGTAHQVLVAPGRIAPDETRYAQITPRPAGVIRTVVAVIGQEVRAGDLLATVDSPDVGKARLELYTQLSTGHASRSVSGSTRSRQRSRRASAAPRWNPSRRVWASSSSSAQG